MGPSLAQDAFETTFLCFECCHKMPPNALALGAPLSSDAAELP